MEYLERRALESALHPPPWWKWYADDTHMVLVKTHAQEFTDHLNRIDDHINWATEGEVTTHTVSNEEVYIGTRTKRALAFLDTWSVINDDGSIKTKVYRKETHMDQNLNFNSDHPLEHKTVVVKTNANVEEKSHVKQALNMNGYPYWLINSIPSTQTFLESTTSVLTNDTSDDGQETVRDRTTKQFTCKKSPVVLFYIKGVSEQIRRVFKQYDILAYFKTENTLRQLSARPKDKILKE